MTDLDPLRSEAPAIVYIDIKSPYAYLSVGPTRALERDLGVHFDWRPFVLDIPSYLGSARLGADGQVVEAQRSAAQWGAVKYSYFDCRRYARAAGLTIRGTEKIWDTNLVATAMLWMRERGHAALQGFLDRVYPPFWVRELDVEDEAVIAALLDELDADGAGFLAWAASSGRDANAHLQAAAFDAGVYGVPTYVVDGELYFGREHLPRVRWHLLGKQGVAPDIAYPLTAARVPASPPERLAIGVSDSLDALLAIPTLLQLAAAWGGDVHWVRIASPASRPMPRDSGNPRSDMHRRWRRRNDDNNWRRYAPQDLERDQIAARIDHRLQEEGVLLSDDVPPVLAAIPLPGIVVGLDDELLIGRQHLPLIATRLGCTPTADAP